MGIPTWRIAQLKPCCNNKRSSELRIVNKNCDPRDMKHTHKLEKSRQSARECRARKKLISIPGRSDTGARESQRQAEIRADQVCRVVCPDRPEQCPGWDAGVPFSSGGAAKLVRPFPPSFHLAFNYDVICRVSTFYTQLRYTQSIISNIIIKMFRL